MYFLLHKCIFFCIKCVPILYLTKKMNKSIRMSTRFDIRNLLGTLFLDLDIKDISNPQFPPSTHFKSIRSQSAGSSSSYFNRWCHPAETNSMLTLLIPLAHEWKREVCSQRTEPNYCLMSFLCITRCVECLLCAVSVWRDDTWRTRLFKLVSQSYQLTNPSTTMWLKTSRFINLWLIY